MIHRLSSLIASSLLMRLQVQNSTQERRLSSGKYAISTHNLPPAEANEGERKFLGTPQTPAGELRPLHPLLMSGSQANMRTRGGSGLVQSLCTSPDPPRI